LGKTRRAGFCVLPYGGILFVLSMAYVVVLNARAHSNRWGPEK